MTTGLTDLQRLERDAFRRFYEDGIVDIYLGLMLIVMGAASLITDDTDGIGGPMTAMLAIALAITVPLLVARRRLLRSRLGAFKPGPVRRRRIRGTGLVLLVSAVVGVVMFGVVAAAAGGAHIEVVELMLPIIWFLNGVIVFGAGAYLLDVPRFYFHGVMWGVAMPLMIWPDAFWDFRIAPRLALGIPGGMICAIGLYRLASFLRTYPPLPRQEDGDA